MTDVEVHFLEAEDVRALEDLPAAARANDDIILVNWEGDVLSLRTCLHTLRGPDLERAQTAGDVWRMAWALAMDRARACNDRRMIEWMLNTGEPVPADIVRELLALKRKRGAPRMPYTPAELVTKIYGHMAAGLSRDESIEKVAKDIGFGPDIVEERSDSITGDDRAYIKAGVYGVRDLLGKSRPKE